MKKTIFLLLGMLAVFTVTLDVKATEREPAFSDVFSDDFQAVTIEADFEVYAQNDGDGFNSAAILEATYQIELGRYETPFMDGLSMLENSKLISNGRAPPVKRLS